MTKDEVKITSHGKQNKRARTQDTYQFPIWLRALTAAEVGKSPSCVPLHAELVVLAQKRQKRPQGTLLKNVISANGAVTSDISQSPDSLLTDIENGGREQPDEFWNGIGVDNNLSVVSSSGGNVR